MDRNWARGAAIASVLAASVAACGSAATASPTSAVAAQPSPTVATPSIEATAISLVSANPISEGCGSPAMEAVIADMGNSGPINLTKEKFAEIWNGWWPKEADKLNRIPAWGPLGEMAGFQGYGEFLPVSGQEDMFLESVNESSRSGWLNRAVEPVAGLRHTAGDGDGYRADGRRVGSGQGSL